MEDNKTNKEAEMVSPKPPAIRRNAVIKDGIIGGRKPKNSTSKRRTSLPAVVEIRDRLKNSLTGIPKNTTMGQPRVVPPSENSDVSSLSSSTEASPTRQSQTLYVSTSHQSESDATATVPLRECATNEESNCHKITRPSDSSKETATKHSSASVATTIICSSTKTKISSASSGNCSSAKSSGEKTKKDLVLCLLSFLVNCKEACAATIDASTKKALTAYLAGNLKAKSPSHIDAMRMCILESMVINPALLELPALRQRIKAFHDIYVSKGRKRFSPKDERGYTNDSQQLTLKLFRSNEVNVLVKDEYFISLDILNILSKLNLLLGVLGNVFLPEMTKIVQEELRAFLPAAKKIVQRFSLALQDLRTNQENEDALFNKDFSTKDNSIILVHGKNYPGQLDQILSFVSRTGRHFFLWSLPRLISSFDRFGNDDEFKNKSQRDIRKQVVNSFFEGVQTPERQLVDEITQVNQSLNALVKEWANSDDIRRGELAAAIQILDTIIIEECTQDLEQFPKIPEGSPLRFFTNKLSELFDLKLGAVSKDKDTSDVDNAESRYGEDDENFENLAIGASDGRDKTFYNLPKEMLSNLLKWATERRDRDKENLKVSEERYKRDLQCLEESEEEVASLRHQLQSCEAEKRASTTSSSARRRKRPKCSKRR